MFKRMAECVARIARLSKVGNSDLAKSYWVSPKDALKLTQKNP